MKEGTILVPMDGSSASKQAAAFAYTLAEATGNPVMLLTVVDVENLPPVRDSAGRSALESALDAGKSILEEELMRSPETLAVKARCVSGKAAEAILTAARDEGASHIIMGSRGLGTVKAAILGSVSAHILKNARCPVTLLKACISHNSV